MIKRFNKDANPPQFEYVFDAVLVSINKKRKLVTKSANKTKYFPAIVKGLYEEDMDAKADVFVFKNTVKEANFEKGDTVTMSTPCDEDSPNFGRCWIELGGNNKVDMLRVAGFAKAKKTSKKEAKAIEVK